MNNKGNTAAGLIMVAMMCLTLLAVVWMITN